ncbi:MAG: DNA-processing protein DprA [Alphaproteobacteria bacterium]
MTEAGLSDDERLDWLRLARTEGIGPMTFLSLLAQFDSAAGALAALPGLARRGGAAQQPRIPSRGEAEREAAALARIGGRLIALADPDYPEALAAIADPPPVLSVRGDPALLHGPAIAVVGARNASANGRRLARTIAEDLAESGITVVSGMARGIDTAAHEGAAARTVAVVAGGIDIVYPPENRPLIDHIAAHGCVVAEQPFGTEPQARHFPRRNRIVSGLARGVVVVEAALRSGSLITARMALQQGREVFAVPGSPLDPRCQGANNLIRQGATLTESARDVLDGLAGSLQPLPRPARRAPPRVAATPVRAAPPTAENGADDLHDRILGLLSHAPIPVDELIRECQVSVPDANAVLLELELAGRISRSVDNQVALAGDPVRR